MTDVTAEEERMTCEKDKMTTLFWGRCNISDVLWGRQDNEGCICESGTEDRHGAHPYGRAKAMKTQM